MRTSLLVRKSTLKKADELARQMKISRNCLFSLALEQFIQQQQNRKLLEKFNAAYADGPDPEEEMLLEKYRIIQRELVWDEW